MFSESAPVSAGSDGVGWTAPLQMLTYGENALYTLVVYQSMNEWNETMASFCKPQDAWHSP
jgi:hypothetical protein